MGYTAASRPQPGHDPRDGSESLQRLRRRQRVRTVPCQSRTETRSENQLARRAVAKLPLASRKADAERLSRARGPREGPPREGRRVSAASLGYRSEEKELGRRRVATGANHPASRSSAFRRGPGTPAVVPRRGTRAPANMLHRTPPLYVKTGLQANLGMDVR